MKSMLYLIKSNFQSALKREVSYIMRLTNFIESTVMENAIQSKQSGIFIYQIVGI